MDGGVVKYESDAFEWKELCRLCLLDDGIKFSIFEEEGVQRQVAYKIETCFPMVIYATDPLPKKICHKCIFKLDTVFEFRNKCLETNSILIEKLKCLPYMEDVQNYLKMTEESVGKQMKLVNGDTNLEKDSPMPESPPKKKVRVSHKSGVPSVQNTFQEVFLDEGSNNEFFPEQNEILLPESHSTIGRNSNNLHKIRVAAVGANAQPGMKNFTNSGKTSLQNKSAESCSQSTPFTHSTGVKNASETVAKQKMVGVENTNAKNHSIVSSKSETFHSKSDRDEGTSSSDEESLKKSADEKRTCRVCKVVFENKEAKYYHNCALPTSWWCEACNKYFYSKHKLVNHKKNYCNPSSYKCSRCNEQFDSLIEVAKHQSIHYQVIMSIRDKNLHPCNTCDRKYGCKYVLKNHVNSHRTLKRKIKPSLDKMGDSVVEKLSYDCKKKFNNASAVTIHTEKEHQSKIVDKTLKENSSPIQSAKDEASDKNDSANAFVFRNTVGKQIVKELQNKKHFTEVHPQNKTNIFAEVPVTKFKDNKNVSIVCKDCGVVCHSQLDLENHQRSHLLHCKLCDRSFSSIRGFSCHNTMVHGDMQQLDSASIISTGTTRTENASKDIFPHLEKPVLSQSIYVQKPELLVDESPASSKNSVLPCNFCSEIFTDEISLQKHSEIHLGNNSTNNLIKLNTSDLKLSTFQCATCNQVCANADALQRHQKIHSVLVACSLCNKKFITKDSLDAHVLSSHSIKNCTICGMTLASENSMHVCNPAGTSFQCSHCNQVFGSLKSLNIHKKSHPNETQVKGIGSKNDSEGSVGNDLTDEGLIEVSGGYRCKICGVMCLTLKGGRGHVRNHSQNSVTHSCPFCEQKYKSLDYLYNHINACHPENVSMS